MAKYPHSGVGGGGLEPSQPHAHSFTPHIPSLVFSITSASLQETAQIYVQKVICLFHFGEYVYCLSLQMKLDLSFLTEMINHQLKTQESSPREIN